MSSSTSQGSQPVHGTVTVDSITGTVTVTGTVAIDSTGLATSAKQDTGNTSLAALVAGVSGTEYQVDVITLPSITGTVTIQDGGNVITVDGTVTASAQPGVDIGDVTINNASGGSAVNIQDGGNAITVDWAGTAPPIGGGAEATALKVTIASDSTGVLSVDDNGSSLTVDGTSVNPATSFSKTITYVSVAQGAAGTTALASASASNKHKLVGACLVGDAAGTVSFTDGTVTLCGAMSIAANAGFVLPASILPYTETAAVNRPLNLVTVTAKVSGMVAILTEP